MDPSIILAGQPVNVLGAMRAGTELAGATNALRQQNTLRQFLGQNGQAVMQGDPAALGQYASIAGPEAAMGVQQGRLDMDRTRQVMRYADTAEGRAVAEHAMRLTDAQRQAEAERIRSGLSQAAIAFQQGNLEGLNATFEQFGLPPVQSLEQAVPILTQADEAYQIMTRSRELAAPAPAPMTPEQRAQWGIPESDRRPYVMGADGVPKVIGGGGQTINVGGGVVGTIPQGYELFTDPTTGARSLRPIPGGPAAQEMQAAETTAGRKAEGNDVATQTLITAGDRAFEAAQSRLVGGVLGQVAAINPESQNAEVVRQVNVLKANAKIGNLQAMREASPTGGALGAVTAPELTMLEDKSGALDPASPYFLRDLADYNLSLLQVVHGPEAGARLFAQSRLGQWASQNGVGNIGAYGQTEQSGTNLGADFEAFSQNPSVQAAAERYGVTLEEMWAVQQGAQGQ